MKNYLDASQTGDPPMSALSPAAQVVLDAYNTYHHYQDIPLSIAAALRAAVDQVKPLPSSNPHAYVSEREEAVSTAVYEVLAEFLAIAAELDGTTTPSES